MKNKLIDYSRLFVIVILSLFISLMGLTKVEALDVEKVDPNSFDNINPLMIYPAQSIRDQNIETESVYNLITNQVTKASSNNTSAVISEGIPIHQEAETLGAGTLCDDTLADIKSERPFEMYYETSRTVIELKNHNINDTVTLNYPTVGTYTKEGQTRTVGCRMVLKNIAYKQSQMSQAYKDEVGKTLDYNYPVIVASNSFYNGTITSNVAHYDVDMNFFYSDNGQAIDYHNVYVTLNSLNGPFHSNNGNHNGYEYAGVNNASTVKLTTDSNLIIEQNGEWSQTKSLSNDFDDYIGGETFSRNSVQFELTDSTTIRMGVSDDIGFIPNGSQTIYTQNIGQWATYGTAPLNNGRHEPVKEVNKTDVYAGDSLTYTVTQKCNTTGIDALASRYKSFMFSDSLPQEVTYQGAKVYSQDTDITSQGKLDYNQEKHLLTWSASSEYLNQMELKGQVIKLVITAVARQDMADEHTITNKAIVNINGVSFESNPTGTKEHVALLDVKKQSNKTVYSIGETGHYTVKTTCIGSNENDVAKSVVLKDNIDNQYAKIIPETLKVYDHKGQDVTSQMNKSVNESGYQINTGKNLDYQESFTVKYDVHFVKGINQNDEVINNAVSSASNTKDAKDDYLVKMIKPELMIEKNSDQEIYSIGDEGVYTLETTQTVKDGIAQNVIIKDSLDTQYTQLINNSLMIKDHDGKDITKDCQITINDQQNGFTIETKRNITYQQKLIIQYKVKFIKGLKDSQKIKNVAKASADEIDEVNDQHDVKVLLPQLEITKDSNKDIYSLYETGHYSLTVKQNRKGAVAKNVVIDDQIDNQYAHIDEKTIKVYDNNEDISKDCHITLNDTKNAFRIETYKDLKYEKTIKILYDVYFDQGLKDQDVIKNKATVSSDENEPNDTDHQVKVVLPQLDIKKTTNHAIAPITGQNDYEVIVNQSQKDAIAYDVIIDDQLDNEGAIIQKDSLHVYDHQGEDITDQVDIEYREGGYSIQTHKNLSYNEKMTVKYTVFFDDSLENETIIKNKATVTGKDVGPEEDEALVKVVNKEAIITKVDEDQQPIPGATLQLVDITDNKVIDQWESTLEPHHTNLIVSHHYQLVETKCPEGYLEATDITFEAQNNSQVVEVKMIDKKAPPVLKTGDDQQSLAILFTLIVVSSLGIAVLAYKKKRKI